MAADLPKGIEKRNENLEKRIEAGKESGALNEKEANRLEKRVENNKEFQEKLGEDGKYSASDRRRMRHRENSISRGVYRQKHDRQRARRQHR